MHDAALLPASAATADNGVPVVLKRRGFIFASAHVRGGGDLGQYWYQDGKLLHKNNTFSDLMTVAHFLIQVSNLV